MNQYNKCGETIIVRGSMSMTTNEKIEAAFQYLYDSGVSFDSDGFVIRVGMEGISKSEWAHVNECADIVDAQTRREQRGVL